jgi:hypothetical protein
MGEPPPSAGESLTGVMGKFVFTLLASLGSIHVGRLKDALSHGYFVVRLDFKKLR